MTKRSKITVFSLLALIVAFGLILTGCPDANGGGDSNGSGNNDPVYTDVRLTPGSHGFAYENTIIGLETGSKYVVRSKDGWHGVKNDGTLLAAKPDPKAASGDTDAAALTVDADSKPATKITGAGLIKGDSYSVFLDLTSGTGLITTNTIGAASTNTVNTQGKNAIVDLSALSATHTVTISAGAGRAGSSLVVLTDLNTDEQLGEPEGPITAHTRIKGKTPATTVSTYSFSALAPAGSAKLEEVIAGNKYFVISDINAAFAATITASAPVAKPIVGTDSLAAASVLDGNVTLTVGKYLAQWRGDWYPLTATGLGDKADDVIAAGAAAQSLSAGNVPLTNDEIYTIYLYKEDDTAAITVNAAYSGARNFVLKATHDTAALTVSAGAIANSATLIHILDSAVVTSGTTASNAAAPANTNAVKTDDTWTFSSVSANSVTVNFKVGEAFITMKSGTSTSEYVLTRS